MLIHIFVYPGMSLLCPTLLCAMSACSELWSGTQGKDCYSTGICFAMAPSFQLPPQSWGVAGWTPWIVMLCTLWAWSSCSRAQRSSCLAALPFLAALCWGPCSPTYLSGLVSRAPEHLGFLSPMISGAAEFFLYRSCIQPEHENVECKYSNCICFLSHRGAMISHLYS